jgi:hypothetical protein
MEDDIMFVDERLELINRVAYELILQGRPQCEALFLVTDVRKRKQLEAVLESAKRRQERGPERAA